MATLKDISTALGLSVTTVSRALNGFPEVNADTRDRVRAAAQAMGYRPNRVAQGLVTGRSGLVGMVVRVDAAMQADPGFIGIMAGLTAALGARDVDLVLNVDQHDDPVEALRRMRERGFLDGFILNAPVVDDPRIAYLLAEGVPFVVHGRHVRDAAYPYYDIDNAAVSADAVALLSALGHRQIALFNAAPGPAYAGQRLAGFTVACRSAGVQASVHSGTPDAAYGYTRAIAVLSGVERPTGIVCVSTRVAEGVLKAAADLRIAVPADLSVIAHDDGQPAAGQPDKGQGGEGLTVTRSPLRDACGPLAAHLVDAIAGRDPAGLRTLVHAPLIPGATTGPAPRR